MEIYSKWRKNEGQVINERGTLRANIATTMLPSNSVFRKQLQNVSEQNFGENHMEKAQSQSSLSTPCCQKEVKLATSS